MAKKGRKNDPNLEKRRGQGAWEPNGGKMMKEGIKRCTLRVPEKVGSKLSIREPGGGWSS